MSDDFTPEAIEASLPPPRDADPPGLRRDIADELADHLACALARESASPDPAAGVRRRFGDPPALAARLYFDAIKGTVLMQKLTLGLSAASLLLVGVAVWQSVQAVAAVRTSADRSAAAYEGLTQKLDELTTQVRAAQPSDGPFDFTLRVESGRGKKLPGFDVSIRRTDSTRTIEGKSDSRGVAIKRRIPPGKYEIEATHASGWVLQKLEVTLDSIEGDLFRLLAPDPSEKATLDVTNAVEVADVRPLAFFMPGSDEPGAFADDLPGATEVSADIDVKVQRLIEDRGATVQWLWNVSRRTPGPHGVRLRSSERVRSVSPMATKRIGSTAADWTMPAGTHGSNFTVYRADSDPVTTGGGRGTSLSIPPGDLFISVTNVVARFPEAAEDGGTGWLFNRNPLLPFHIERGGGGGEGDARSVSFELRGGDTAKIRVAIDRDADLLPVQYNLH